MPMTTYWVVMLWWDILHIDMDWVATALQRAAGGTAKFIDVVILKLNALLNQLVDVRCLDFRILLRVVVVVTWYTTYTHKPRTVSRMTTRK